MFTKSMIKALLVVVLGMSVSLCNKKKSDSNVDPTEQPGKIAVNDIEVNSPVNELSYTGEVVSSSSLSKYILSGSLAINVGTSANLIDMASSDVDKVCGFPAVKSGYSDPDFLKKTHCADVGDDGKFGIHFGSSSYDWLFFFINSGKSRHEQIVSYIGLKGTGDVLSKMPVDQIKNNIKLGNLETENTDALSEKTIEDNKRTCP